MASTTTATTKQPIPMNDENDWTQVGDPHKRRQIQNRISKRRQRERIRQKKAQDKANAAKQYEHFFHHHHPHHHHHNGPMRRFGSPPMSLTSSSSPGGTPYPTYKWKSGIPSPPGTVAPPDCQQRYETFETPIYTGQPNRLYIPNCSTQSDQSSTSSTSSTSTAPWGWSQHYPRLSTQNPGTPMHDSLSERSRSPAVHGPSPLASSAHPSWPSAIDLRGMGATSENVHDSRLRECSLEPAVPTLPSSTGFSYPSIEVPYAQPKLVEASSAERVHSMIACSQAMGYPTFDPSVPDYYNRLSPQS